MANTVKCEIVSAEEELFSGEVQMLIATGVLGDLGIAPGHAPLLTQLAPGPLRIILKGGEETIFYASGGMLEVQPNCITILADTAQRAGDMDEAAAIEAQKEASRLLKEQSSDIDYSAVTAQFAEAVAQLRTIRKVRKQLNR